MHHFSHYELHYRHLFNVIIMIIITAANWLWKSSPPLSLALLALLSVDYTVHMANTCPEFMDISWLIELIMNWPNVVSIELKCCCHQVAKNTMDQKTVVDRLSLQENRRQNQSRQPTVHFN